ncbi:cAMP-regulated D2 protein [Hypsizygus marmoreus]|uniref:Carboxylic ester hydrolase n=1 Tax=Hypsizygus marmoreus TaxID=39966 RepID=A0A369JLA8_HYPMA|nr:cAMP-regulated D2 protein [Hypsizygus marmoreus]
MVALNILLASLLVATSWASPLPNERLQFPKFDPKQLLCQLPIIKKFLCPRTGNGALNVETPVGLARGTADPSGANRFTVKYATANRWAPSTLASTWGLPNGSLNETTLPLACPQPGVDPAAYTEDCLSMVLYVPPGLTLMTNAPTLMWVHGGSFVVGSATGPGLDGSKLAIATNSIVAVVQYRLGALGFMSPDGTTNLAVKDIVNAMQFLRKVAPAFGGTASKITLAGQSAGANMIRALLAVPSASSLFKSAILQSDPMNYGFLSPATQQTLQTNYNGLINCGAADTSCWNSLSLSAILDAQQQLFNTAASLDPSAGVAEPIRPVRDGSFITSPLDSTAAFPSVNKPVLVSSVLHEAGPAIYQQFPDPIPGDWFAPVCDATFGSERTNAIVSSPHYNATPGLDGSVDARPQLQLVGTDYLWKCSGWTFARTWVQNGGTAYVGQYQVGASYPGNDAISFCTSAGVVCHQDDIQIVFGTVSNPTAAQSALVTEMQKRYKAFLTNGNPNVAGLPNWSAATSSNVHALKLGGSGEATVGACDPSFWGQGVEYDYQVYGI